jgi:hypothetical protein
VSEPQKIIVRFNSWAGRTAVTAELVCATPRRYRVRWLEPTSRRPRGSMSLVPKKAVMPMFGEKLP